MSYSILIFFSIFFIKNKLIFRLFKKTLLHMERMVIVQLRNSSNRKRYLISLKVSVTP